jgi:enoyl-CoA hydratase
MNNRLKTSYVYYTTNMVSIEKQKERKYPATMKSKNYTLIRYEAPEDHVRVICLNRPGKLNALSKEMHREIQDALDRAGEEEDLRALVFWGEGSSFSAGTDVTQMKEHTARSFWFFMNDYLHKTVKKIRSFPMPVIFAVHGYVIGGALEMMISGDFVVAGDSTKFYMPEVKIGIPSIIEAALVSRQIGILQAKELVYFGEVWDAARIKELNLVNRVVPDDRIREEAMTAARKLTRLSPVALRVQKEVCNKWLTTDLEAAVDYSKALVLLNFASEDKDEGMRAYLEGRKPTFTGR